MTREDANFDSWGEPCAAWLYRPAEPLGDPPPCIVMAHGFSATRADGLPAYAERFAAAGLAVLVFDYRHFGDSGGEPRQLLDIRRQLADWASAISYLRTREDVDPARLVLWGSSFSGGHVIATAARDHRVAAVIAQVPYTDGLASLARIPPATSARLTVAGLRDEVARLRGAPPHLVPAVGPPGSLAAMTTPDAEPGFLSIVPGDSRWRNEVSARVALRLAAYRPGRLAARVTCPLLVCAGTEDAITPFAGAERAAGRAPRGELASYPIGHFEIYRGAPWERAVVDQIGFLARHALARAPVADPARTAAPA